MLQRPVHDGSMTKLQLQEVLPDLPERVTPAEDIINVSPELIKDRDVRRLDLFLRYAEYLLEQIRQHGLFGIGQAPRQGFSRGYEYYENDAARVFALATSINRFTQNHGHPPRFLAPQTATEKLLVMKMFGEIPDGPPADKLKAELFVPPDDLPRLTLTRRLWMATSPSLPDNDLIPPGRYFLKTNFGAGNNIPVRFPLDEEMRSTLLNKQSKWFERRYRHGFWAGEWRYQNISPRIFLEENLAEEGQDIADWKLWVTGGRVQIVQVDQERSSNHIQRVYDRDFNILPDELYYPSDFQPGLRPPTYDNMVLIAESICTNLEFARVDFFSRNNDLYLGEITLCTYGAKKKMRSAGLDRRLGQAWSGTHLFPECNNTDTAPC